MFSSKLKRPLLALAVTAGLLTVAGPASAEVVTDNKDPEQVNSPKRFSIDMGTSEAFSVPGPAPLNIGSSEVFELNTIWTNGDGRDLKAAGPAGLKAGASEILYETFTPAD